MKDKSEIKKLTCGLIMPISSIDGCSIEHWNDIRSIITECITNIKEYEIIVKLVSDSDDSGIIQKRIVQNIYDSDIVICDVSAKNPNVMFELGMRLAFDKPTIIIKDDITGYSFDTGVIEHIDYPRDLRFNKINIFKERLAKSFIATYTKSLKNSDDSFLKSFGTFKIAKIEEKEVGSDKIILDMLHELNKKINSINNLGSYNVSNNRAIIFDKIVQEAIKTNFPTITNLNHLYHNDFFKELIEKKCFEYNLGLNSKKDFLSLYNDWFFKNDDSLPILK